MVSPPVRFLLADCWRELTSSLLPQEHRRPKVPCPLHLWSPGDETNSPACLLPEAHPLTRAGETRGRPGELRQEVAGEGARRPGAPVPRAQSRWPRNFFWVGNQHGAFARGTAVLGGNPPLSLYTLRWGGVQRAPRAGDAS